ncbi:type II toxin-antitoxin system toxin ribonuclease VapC11 [Ornithinibacter aureus]|uniref:Ribonuclease VapC n=1 Tax=Ornithinibacter aureus TaxID=622664 RepID=A0ABP8JD75_9MICO|nr:PIN domain nuclease [Ornithinibacter aureus]KAF0832573.1 hypothetical protein C8E84_0324 [Ornithinibacter aureus]
MTVLADTSAWIEFDNGTDSPAALRLRSLLTAPGTVTAAYTEPILMEFLAGARSTSAQQRLRALLDVAQLLPLAQSIDFEEAVRIYRQCRSVGVTPRGLVDCLIAAVAQRTGASLLSHDLDLARIAEVIGIPLDEASLRP